MPEQCGDHGERRLRVRALRVQRSETIRPVLPERGHLLIVRSRLREVSRVPLDAMERRRSMLPGRCQADLAVVGGVGQAPPRHNVLRQMIPDVREHLALVDVRACQ